MFKVTKVIEWDMGHRIPNHKSKCRNLHGHRYRWELTVAINQLEANLYGKGRQTFDEDWFIGGQGSDEGMVIDFGDLKKEMMLHVHDVLDHGFMYYTNDALIDNLHTNSPLLKYIPVSFIPTVENLAKYCYELVWEYTPNEIEFVRSRLYETPNSWADYESQ